MTLVDLEEIEKRVNAATPGPWFWNSYAGIWSSGQIDEEKEPTYIASVVAVSGDTAAHPPDAEFIAHAREDIPALLSEVRKLKALLKKIEYSGDHSELAECCPDCGGDPKHQDDCELAEALK